MGKLIFITGGAGSGKSEYAEQRAEQLAAELGGPLYYIATMDPGPRDPDTVARIAKHQRRRADKGYTTIECPTNIASVRAQLLQTRASVSTHRGTLPRSSATAPCTDFMDSHGHTPHELSHAVFLLEDLTNLYANEVYGTAGHPHAIVAPILQLATEAGAVILVANELYRDGIRYAEETDRFLRELSAQALQLADAAEEAVEVVYGISVRLK